MKLKFYSFFILALFLFVLSCSRNNSSDKLLFEANKEFSNIRWVALVSETGCSSCNVKFSELIATHLNDSIGLIFVSATGRVVDLTPYYSDTLFNVVAANRDFFVRKKINDVSSFLYINDNNEIDSVVVIDARVIGRQLRDIELYMNVTN